MKKKRLAGLFIAGAIAAMLSGCVEVPEVISDAQAAREAMNTANSIYFEGDFEAVNQETDILADEKVAGRMEESGFVHSRWTVTAGGETWFYMELVTDEPINEDTDDYVSATTFGYYDENDNCIGYAQQRAMKNDDSHAYDYYFMDADGNLMDYRMEENGEYFFDADGGVIARANSAMDGIGESCHIQIDMEEGSNTQINFMDKMVMYIEQFDELKFWHSN